MSLVAVVTGASRGAGKGIALALADAGATVYVTGRTVRSSYVASFFAAPLLVDGGKLLVNTSSFGGTCYMHGPAYGAVKAGVDKMAHDMAEDLRPFGVAAVSLWMGFLRTERTEALFTSTDHRYAALTANAESAEFPGRVIAALATSENRMAYSGQVLVAAEVAAELGVTDRDGRQPASHRPALGSPPQYSPVVIH